MAIHDEAKRSRRPLSQCLWPERSGGACACTRVMCVLLVVGLIVFAAVNGAMWLATTQHDIDGSEWRKKNTGMFGANLGGWLLAEKWLVDRNQTSLKVGKIVSPYEVDAAQGAIDERSLSILLRKGNRLDALDHWRNSYVTRADFAAMRRSGLNIVRIPFGWWLCVDDEAPDGYHRGAGLNHLDDAMRWAEQEQLKVILDLHGAPGSQNGRQTAGHENPIWTAANFDAELSLKVIATVAARYASSPALIGFTLLNEPELPTKVLVPFYQRAYAAVRAAGCLPSKVAVIINVYAMDAVITHGWLLNRVMPAATYPNLVYDLHIYYAFLPLWLHPLLSLRSLTSTVVWLQSMAVHLAGRPCIIGEWSLRLPFDGPLSKELAALGPERRHSLLRDFSVRQLEEYSAQAGCVGVVFWTWNAPKHEDAWSLQRALSNGWVEAEDIERIRSRMRRR